MKVLVIGRGGREHAIVSSLKKSSKVSEIYCAPGNGGMEKDAICLPIIETDFKGLVEVVTKYGIDLTIVGPENPLLAGIVDYFKEHNLAIIGPNQAAARIEGSKSYAKELMKKYRIPTGDYQVFESKEEAINYVMGKGTPIVIKADGLAAGKGVTVAYDLDQAIRAIDEIMGEKVFGEAGNKIVIEEYLAGEELTVMAFVDGTTVLPMEPAQDYKAIFDGNKGPNTGGMGSYSPVSQLKQDLLNEIYHSILKPITVGMAKEGHPFKGILYAGLMITEKGPKVIEFNARMGDPETQVVLPRLKTDLLEVFLAIVNNQLENIKLEWDDKAAVCVIMSSKGYPGEYSTGMPIIMENIQRSDTQIFFAGVKKVGEQLVTSGGRVLGVTALAPSIKAAREKAYQGVNQIQFTGAYYRQDIADKR
ncbi:phosphoribosylamine--glycine ligase [Vulcanibacillus modesticaldus]|uniref:Phosphoribosylamine--glycine ligase n=1 Tax=Vulcanibacillus modesticaldus TaxID=337097 RepID=A0A1D2YUX9_9BACI|nr:phosphoribosylamine--glycine ligase [Vulcanibacillus modesticaldus]OEF99471.1 phosphoribosylamine--glycine ligase [Vulcanibacillus modesticaldus]